MECLRLLVVVLSVVVELLYRPHHLAQLLLLGLAPLRRRKHRPLFAMRLALGAAMAVGSQVLSFTVISHIPDLLRRLMLARGAVVAEGHARLIRSRLGHVNIIALVGGRLVSWGPVAHHLVGVCCRVGALVCRAAMRLGYFRATVSRSDRRRFEAVSVFVGQLRVGRQDIGGVHSVPFQLLSHCTFLDGACLLLIKDRASNLLVRRDMRERPLGATYCCVLSRHLEGRVRLRALAGPLV